MTVGIEKHLSEFARSNGIELDYVNRMKMLDAYLKYYDMKKKRKREFHNSYLVKIGY